LFDHLSFLTARDFGDSFEVIYELYSYYHKQSIEFRARVSRESFRKKASMHSAKYSWGFVRAYSST
ncbi:MAG: NADH-quinone oxidoreductase subunit C, partial [Armatimonadetes bacterium]|nr:NADH-quinone oxidoreductase subunit C [Armatimonadota bacterium]